MSDVQNTTNWRRLKRLGRKPLDAAEMGMAGVSNGVAGKGEMVTFDGQTGCAGCGRVMPDGARIYWACSMQQECDPYCTACARERGQRMVALCEAIEADHRAGRLAI